MRAPNGGPCESLIRLRCWTRPRGGGDRRVATARWLRPQGVRWPIGSYAADADHPWNKLHQPLFVRHTPDGSRHIHSTDPLLYRGGTFLLEGESHRKALAVLDQFLTVSGDRPVNDPLKRLYLQRDLWAAFDYSAWYPDDWVFQSKYEPAAIALRTRLAKAVGKLALGERELTGLPDNYGMALKSKQYSTTYDPKHPERPFLPSDLFDPTGQWVRFHEQTALPMAQKHFDGAGGRAAHVIFLRLPDGRAATEQYLKELCSEEPFLKEAHRPSVKQFPTGTMVAMVRRALAVDTSAKVRVTRNGTAIVPASPGPGAYYSGDAASRTCTVRAGPGKRSRGSTGSGRRPR